MVRVHRVESIAERTYFRFPTSLGDARVAHNEDQGTLARALGINRPYLAMIESGYCLPGPDIYGELVKRYLGFGSLYPEWVQNIINGVAKNGA